MFPLQEYNMQEVVYKCDHCKKEIGKNFHISLGLNKGLSGIAIPPLVAKDYAHSVNSWRVQSVESGFIHFHVVCIGEYFKKMAHKVIKDNFPDSFKKNGKKK